MKRRLLSVIACLVIVGLLIGFLSVMPSGAIKTLMGYAAKLSVGMQQPKESVEYLNEWVTKSPPILNGPLTQQPVILGEVTVQSAGSIPSANIPEKQAGAGVVLTQQMSTGKTFVQGVAIKNNTTQTVDIAKSLTRAHTIAFDTQSTAVQVLITHTHTTECYLGYDAGFFNPDDKSRTDDAKKNMIAVGEQVAQQLRQAGIGVIHDTEIHDQPYSSAYSHSRKAVEKYLKEYPSIAVVLDIHRDAVYQSDGTRVKPTAVIDGKKAAQMMILVGIKNTTSTPNPHTADNISFGARLQQTMHREYAGLMRPMVLANARYNQHLCNGMILVEVGSDVNTLEEACYSGELLGKGLAETLKGL